MGEWNLSGSDLHLRPRISLSLLYKILNLCVASSSLDGGENKPSPGMNDYERWLNKYFKAVNPIALHTPWGASYMVEIPTSFSASGVMIKEDK